MSDRVLVLGDDVRAFLAVVRSLGRRGAEVHVAPNDPAAPALASRYIAAVHRLPVHATEPARWAAALRELIATFDYRLIVPCSDASLIQLKHHSAAIGEDRLALPNGEAFTVFTSKQRTRTLARQLAVPVAAGQGLDARDCAADLERRYGLPLLLKPIASYRVGDPGDKRGVRMIRDCAELDQALAEGARDDCLVEGFFPGDGVGVSVIAAKGRIVQAYQHRRLEQSTETGVSTSRISEPVDPALAGHVERLAEAVKLDGVAMFEFRHDRSSGAHVLLEVNPRFWGSLPLALAAGADFPAMLYEQFDRGTASPRPYRFGLIKTDLSGEYDRKVLRAEKAEGPIGRAHWLMAALATPITVKRSRSDSWAADDPAPYWAERRELSERIRAALSKRLWGRPEPRTAPNPWPAGGLRSA